MRQTCKYDLVLSLLLIQILTQSTPMFHTSFHIKITILLLTRMTSLYCVSPVQSITLIPSFQYVCRHQTSTLINSKFVLTLASEEQLSLVCLISICAVLTLSLSVCPVLTYMYNWKTNAHGISGNGTVIGRGQCKLLRILTKNVL